ncbi:hypothetical protein C8A00DRAFT_19760 [Chaetomidium leptoderma]|uniref:Uncharacterized protein n=1 Tax=Chaetomidium leptoderma TaxID=669021 RepID=A0AAN6ZTH0_9PEZI|nr:hypothetical protein C8A00DRAFT_19760 [Chaetomidium leptoderma]
MEHASRLDGTILKRILRFLLPMAGQKLGSSSLVSLLCLDWVSAELDLDLEFESLWETELTSINILVFLVDCFAASGDAHHKDLTVDHSEVGDLVIRAMDQIGSRKAPMLPTTGRDKLRDIVKTALESGRALDWVSVYGEGILRVITSGPSEALLEHCQGKEDTRSFNRQGIKPTDQTSQDDRENWWPVDDDDGSVDYERDYSDEEATKDYTACDKECGYCGRCDY